MKSSLENWCWPIWSLWVSTSGIWWERISRLKMLHLIHLAQSLETISKRIFPSKSVTQTLHILITWFVRKWKHPLKMKRSKWLLRSTKSWKRCLARKCLPMTGTGRLQSWPTWLCPMRLTNRWLLILGKSVLESKTLQTRCVKASTKRCVRLPCLNLTMVIRMRSTSCTMIWSMILPNLLRLKWKKSIRLSGAWLCCLILARGLETLWQIMSLPLSMACLTGCKCSQRANWEFHLNTGVSMVSWLM